MADTSAPDVSVLIPTFNRLWSLPKAVESCRAAGGEVEIIVVDDGSSDGTSDWLATQKDVVAIRQENQGKDWAVNRAFAAARGAYVRFLDSDDWLAAGVNAHQLEIARRTGADIVAGPFLEVFEDSGRERLHPMPASDDFIAQQLGETGSSHYTAYLFRREFLGAVPHRQEFGALDDRMFVIEAAIAGPKVALSEEIAFHHRQHEGDRLQFQTGAAGFTTAMNHLKVFRRAASMLERREALTERRRKAIAKGARHLPAQLAAFDLAEARTVADWLRDLDPELEYPGGALRRAAYRTLGFTATEQLVGLTRRR